jgi:UDP-N-acetylmuramoylalanine--D-glutamate ligase
VILKNKRITVIGLGKSGFATAKFLADKGALVRVTDSSQKKEILENAGYLKSLGVRVETGVHSEIFLQDADLIITSPGVPKKSFPLLYAKKHRIPVISEVELAYLFCKGRIVAVTGSNGKTTTCHLITRMFQNAGQRSVLCGNVGNAFLEALPQIDAKTIVVLELSSFQLEDSPKIRPSIAVILNISPNHLDRHRTLRNYTKAKAKIYQNQRSQDWLVLNHDNRITKNMDRSAQSKIVRFSKTPLKQGIYLTPKEIVVGQKGLPPLRLKRDACGLRGDHNLENMMAAVAVASIAKIPLAAVRKTLEEFVTLEHRIEFLGEIGGVRFVNDSKSTTVDSTRAALESVQSPIILIAGGRDKGSDFKNIEDCVFRRVKEAVLYGEARKKIGQSWKKFKRWTCEEKFDSAVQLAFSKAEPGDAILLSPMCASFDQFSSFEERGETFKKIFKLLSASWTR